MVPISRVHAQLLPVRFAMLAAETSIKLCIARTLTQNYKSSLGNSDEALQEIWLQHRLIQIFNGKQQRFQGLSVVALIAFAGQDTSGPCVS